MVEVCLDQVRRHMNVITKNVLESHPRISSIDSDSMEVEPNRHSMSFALIEREELLLGSISMEPQMSPTRIHLE